MFTGLVADVGRILSAEDSAVGRELRIATSFTDLVEGESIAVDGVCLTVRSHVEGPTENSFVAAAVNTTLDRTTLGSLAPGDRVNLERSLRAADRLGGHLVQGHVDATGRVQQVSEAGDAFLIDLWLPEELLPLMVPQGSVTVDGVSLTVNALLPHGIQLSIIEYTRNHTTLGALEAGDGVNIEADVLAKHVRRLVGQYIGAGNIAET